MAIYTFSISQDFPNAVVDPEALRIELVEDFTFAEPINVSTTGDVVTVEVVTNLSPSQEAALNQAVAQHTGASRSFSARHFEEEFDGPRLIRETWWARVLAGGVTFSKKVTERLYVYNGNHLMTESYAEYNPDGSVLRARNWAFKTVKDGTTTRVLKVEQ